MTQLPPPSFTQSRSLYVKVAHLITFNWTTHNNHPRSPPTHNSCDGSPHINFSKGGASAVDCLIWWSPLSVSDLYVRGADHLSLLSPCIFSPRRVSALLSARRCACTIMREAPCSNNNIKISVFERDFGHCCAICVYFNGCASEGGIVCGCNKVKHLSPSLCVRRPLAAGWLRP